MIVSTENSKDSKKKMNLSKLWEKKVNLKIILFLYISKKIENQGLKNHLGKISHALGLEELTLLKWPYYPKQSTGLMQPLSNYPWLFSQN